MIAIKPVNGFPGYYVGSDGSVWSKWRVRPRSADKNDLRRLTDTMREMRGSKNKGAYGHVTLVREGETCGFGIHRLVLEVFHGPCPDGMEACHRDGNPANNRLSNLYWGTHADNMQDAIRHGTFQRIIDAAAAVNRGRKLSDEVRARMSAAKKGKPKTEEHKAAIKATHWTKRPDAAEIIERSAAKHRGKKHTPEHRAKISEGNYRRWARTRETEQEWPPLFLQGDLGGGREDDKVND